MFRSMLLAALVAGCAMAATPARAQKTDCWFPPKDAPSLPDGASASREDMNSAVQAVKVYSAKLNEHLSCLQVIRDSRFINMNKEQQARWVEDYNKLIDDLEALELSLNEQIRAFNASTNVDGP